MKLFIDWEAKQKLDLYVKECTDEISGLGRVILDNGTFHIKDIFLLKQECSSSETTIDNDDVALFLMNLINEDLNPEEIKLWWHSHANMGCFWSQTDEDTASKFINGWMISLVVNKRGDFEARLDLYDPIHVTVEDIQLVTSPPEPNEALIEAVQAEVKDKVSYKRYNGYCGNANWYEEHGWRAGRVWDYAKCKWVDKEDADNYRSSWRSQHDQIADNRKGRFENDDFRDDYEEDGYGLGQPLLDSTLDEDDIILPSDLTGDEMNKLIKSGKYAFVDGCLVPFDCNTGVAMNPDDPFWWEGAVHMDQYDDEIREELIKKGGYVLYQEVMVPKDVYEREIRNVEWRKKARAKRLKEDKKGAAA